jgi:MFS family permease
MTPKPEPEPEPIEYRVGTLHYTRKALLKVCSWLLVADIGLAFRSRALGPMIQLLLKGLGASNQVIALATVTFPQGISLVLNPVVAHYSDRFRSRWGRRLPFIYITIPILTVTMAAMGFTPMLADYLSGALGENSPGRQVCGLIVFMILFTLFDVAAIVQGRTWGGLINDILPQQVLGRFMAASRIVSLVAGIIFTQFFLAKVEHYQLQAFIVLSVIYGSTMIILFLFVREGGYPPPPPPVESKGLAALWDNFKGFLKECYGNPYYRWLMLMLCIDDIAFGAVNTFSLFHAQSLNISLQTFGTCSAIQYGIAFVLAYPIGMLADKFHPFRVSALALLLYGVFALWSGLNIKDTPTFIIGFMAHGIFATTYNTAAASMGFRLLARTRFTVLSAGMGIVGTVISMIVTPLLGMLLDATNSEYRYCYLVGSAYVAMGMPIYYVVYRKIQALGGLEHYTAPDEIPGEAVEIKDK